MSTKPPPGTDGSDDVRDVKLILSGDRAAFERLYLRHKDPLFRTALAFTHDPAAAEDLLQEAFLRAYRYLERVQLQPSASLRPWLHRILINLTYDWCARYRYQTVGPTDGDESLIDRLAAVAASPEREAEDRDRDRGVASAISQLPFKQRIVVVLFYLHDMDLQEIAATLNLPAGTIKSRLHYGRIRLREILEAEGRQETLVTAGWGHVHASS